MLDNELRHATSVEQVRRILQRENIRNTFRGDEKIDFIQKVKNRKNQILQGIQMPVASGTKKRRKRGRGRKMKRVGRGTRGGARARRRYRTARRGRGRGRR